MIGRIEDFEMTEPEITIRHEQNADHSHATHDPLPAKPSQAPSLPSGLILHLTLEGELELPPWKTYFNEAANFLKRP
jgi:hypothetical protein